MLNNDVEPKLELDKKFWRILTAMRHKENNMYENVNKILEIIHSVCFYIKCFRKLLGLIY